MTLKGRCLIFWRKIYWKNCNMLTILTIFFLLWFARTAKNVLFWVYLWQLKEYHSKRFADHFRTAKGRSLLLDKLATGKIILLLLFFLSPLIVFIVLPFIYLSESLKTGYGLYKKKLIKPVFTKKATVIIFLVFLLEIFFIIKSFSIIDEKIWLSILYFPLLLLTADLLTPLIVSLLVLAFQPLSWTVKKTVMAKAKRKRNSLQNLTVIGITGSYGKTSTKEFLATILSSKYNVLKTKKNINAEIGIAKTILGELKPEHQILIAEIGAYEREKIKEVCGMIRPKMGILTGINSQHMATFGSQENIIKGKFELIDSLPEKGIAIVNGNNDYINERIGGYKGKTENIIVNNDIAKNVLVEKEQLSFQINNASFKINVLGKHNLDNILLAIAAAQKLGMSLQEISKACLDIKDNQIIKKIPVIINASYSANPTGVTADLEYLKLYAGKKAIVMPCLIELGESSKEVHKKIGEKINEVCDLAVITTKDHFAEIREKTEKAVFIDNPQEIIKRLEGFKNPEDVILLEGRVPKQLIESYAH